jgi:hypothetical protein
MPLTDTAVRNAKHYGKNYTLKDMDGLSLRATLSTALNELGYDENG